ncbi:MAG: septum formation initiator family protein [Candidatus Methylomirabilales bacterium]
MAARVRAQSMQQELPFGVRVRRGKRTLVPRMKPILLVGGILLLGLLVYVWQHVQVVRLGYQVERLRAARATLVQERKALRVELGKLRSLERVETLARGKLGMIDPDPGQMIFLEEPR